jgi:hypothetical protein
MVEARSRCVADEERRGRLWRDLCGVQRRREVGHNRTRRIDRGGWGAPGAAARGAKRTHGRPEKTYQVFFYTSYFLSNGGGRWATIGRTESIAEGGGGARDGRARCKADARTTGKRRTGFFSTSYFLGVQTTEIRLNTGYTWEAIHRVSLLVTLFPLKLPTIWNRARLDGVT